MRVGLNLLHAMPAIGGGWNYIESLVWALGECDPENEYVAFVTEASGTLVPHTANFRKVAVPINSRRRAVRIGYENSVLNFQVARERLDVVHWFANTCSSFTPAASVVTVYDLQAIPHTNLRSRLRAAYLYTMMKSTVRHAAKLLPMSAATARALAVQYGAKADRMSVVPPIVKDSFVPSSSQSVAELRKQYGLPARFWLYVAHLYPHKNHERLLKAYAHAINSMGTNLWPLVLRGDSKDAKQDIRTIINNLGLHRPRDFAAACGYPAVARFIFGSIHARFSITL